MSANSGSESGRQSAKLERFERLAEKRMTELLKQMRLVGNLANKGNYAYTEAHTRQIVEAIEGELKQLRAKFRQEESASAQGFIFRK